MKKGIGIFDVEILSVGNDEMVYNVRCFMEGPDRIHDAKDFFDVKKVTKADVFEQILLSGDCCVADLAKYLMAGTGYLKKSLNWDRMCSNFLERFYSEMLTVYFDNNIKKCDFADDLYDVDDFLNFDKE